MNNKIADFLDKKNCPVDKIKSTTGRADSKT